MPPLSPGLSPRVLLAALVLLPCCRPAEPPARPKPLYAVSDVSRLHTGRVGPSGALLVTELNNGSREVFAVNAQGASVWRSPPQAQVLLGTTNEASIYTVAEGEGPRQVSVLAASTGKVERTFTLARPRQRQDRWERDGDELLVIEAPTDKAASAVTLVDGATGAVRWTRDIGVSVPMDLGWVYHSPVLFGSSIHLLCKAPNSPEFYPDLCRLSRADGSLAPPVKGPIVDLAAAGSTLLVLRDKAVEALAEDGTSRWKHPLPSGYSAQSLVSRGGWLVVMSSLMQDKDHHQEQLLALDAADGHTLWTRDTEQGGEHFQSSLAMGDDRVFFVSNLGPNMRVLDRQGTLILSDRWETRFVVATEVVGGFVEGLNGPPLFQGPFLALPRQNKTVEVYRVP